jgi:hypothetical protein
MKLNKVKHITYVFGRFKSEGYAHQLPIIVIKNQLLNDDILSIAKNNPEIIKHKDVTCCIWFNTFFAYDDALNAMIINSKEFRASQWRITYKTMDEYIDSMYNEYMGWLTFLNNTSGTLKNRVKTNNLISFLLVYNNRMYYLKKISKQLKDESLLINPFINFWYCSKDLGKYLDLPINTIFLPLCKLDYMVKLRNRLLY